jgi:gephyrin
MDSLTASILIVSTTAAQDPSTDASASVLRNVLAEDGGGRWTVLSESIVSDDAVAIQRQIAEWADGADAPHLIITTGGTGFAVSDGTPEVCVSWAIWS